MAIANMWPWAAVFYWSVNVTLANRNVFFSASNLKNTTYITYEPNWKNAIHAWTVGSTVLYILYGRLYVEMFLHSEPEKTWQFLFEYNFG